MSILTTNFIKLLSICGVIVIHTSSFNEYAFLRNHDYFSDDFLAVILGQLFRFSVPLFILLSAYGLSMSSSHKFKIKTYFKKRFSKVFIPFFTFSLIAFLFDLSDHGLTWFKIKSALLKYFLVQGADYHFYFLIIIMQFYILFLFLRKINSIALLIFFLVFHTAISSPGVLYLLSIKVPVFVYPASLFIYWLPYFYFGILLAQNRKLLRFLLNLNSSTTYIFILVSFGAVLFEYVFMSDLYHNKSDATPGWYNHFNRISVLVYSLASLAALMKVSRAKLIEKYSEQFNYLASLSFCVFIIHTLLIRMLQPTFASSNIIIFSIAIIFLSFLVAQFLSWLLSYKKLRYLRLIFGLPN